MAGAASTTVRTDAEHRRRELAEAAARLFAHRGFHGVSLAAVAAEVGITAPALYRHYPGKAALLVGAVTSGLDVADAALPFADLPLGDLLGGLADAALRRRDVWVLLQRELRHLDPAERAGVAERFDLFVDRFAARLHRARGDGAPLRLLVTAVLATLASPSTTTVRIPRPAYRATLAAAALAAATATLPAPHRDPADPADPTDAAARPAPEPLATRGEQLLATAVDLFHERGYAAVSLDDIGAAVGVAGPSVYHHFATKSALLVTAFGRAADRLATPAASAGPPALDELVRRYVELGVTGRELFGVYVTEAVNLPPDAARRIRRSLARGVDQWVGALCAERPELDRPTARVLVHAARAVVGDVVRIGDLHTRPNIAAELDALVHAVLRAAV